MNIQPERLGEKPAKNVPVFAPLKLVHLMSKEFSDDVWLVEELIPKASMTIIAGAPSSYKTWLLLDLCRCVLTGEPWLDHFATEQMNILFIDEESNEKLLQDRLKLLGVTEDLGLWFLIRAGVKATKEWTGRILRFTEEKDIKLVVIDSFARINSQDENSASAIAPVMDEIKQLCDAGLTVIVLHHTRKGNGSENTAMDMMRGSGDIAAAVDNQISIFRKQGEKRATITHNKSRYGEEVPVFQAEFTKEVDLVEFLYAGDGEIKTNKQAELARQIVELLKAQNGAWQKRIIDELQTLGITANQHTVSKVLKRLEKDGKVYAEQGVKNKICYFLNGP